MQTIATRHSAWTSDTTDPEFTFCPQGGDLGCNPVGIPEPGTAIATDNCGIPTVSVLPGDIIVDGCYRSYHPHIQSG
jgi:hypothetical protein